MNFKNRSYDVIVIGAGHAGCEASLACARMGCSTLLLTIDMDKIASMACSPSIGGIAKGQLVKEIDALGGQMAKITDSSAIQYKTLNTRKGPAVHSTRTQNDKALYSKKMKEVLETTKNLDLVQAMAEKLIIENKTIKGVVDSLGFEYLCKALVIATGTFLKGKVHIGSVEIKAGRAAEPSSINLAKNLSNLGFQMGRMKTGTPPRLHADSIDFSKFKQNNSDTNPKPFSFSNTNVLRQMLPSFIGETNINTYEIAKQNLKFSALYGGYIKGKSARYCPSFEDKIVKFPQRKKHHVILEYEGMNTKEIYASGLGNSLPFEVQHQLVQSVNGLNEAKIIRPAYAIEYDYINPLELSFTLETKKIKNLFLSGQINGTSGYEEAGAQGIWAGINAACAVQKRKSFILDRSQAYMGVMIDDLVIKGTNEPYRLFTSRAEYRLLLREDNADLRLAHIGYELGLVDKEFVNLCKQIRKQTKSQIQKIKTTIVKPEKKINELLEKKGSNKIKTGVKLEQLLKRAELNYSFIKEISSLSNNFFESPSHSTKSDDMDSHLIDYLRERSEQQAQIAIKYEGYISRQLNEIKKYQDLEKIKIPDNFDYSRIHGLSNELKEKLCFILPKSLGQASRIDGMTPAGISVLMIGLNVYYKKNNQNYKRS